MQDKVFLYFFGGENAGAAVLALLKNIFYLAAAFFAFSLWFASTVNTPQRLEDLEKRVLLIQAAQNRIEGKLEFLSEDLSLLKTYFNKTK